PPRPSVGRSVAGAARNGVDCPRADSALPRLLGAPARDPGGPGSGGAPPIVSKSLRGSKVIALRLELEQGVFGERGEVPAALGLDGDHVFNAHRAPLGVVEAGLDGDDLASPEDVVDLADARRLVDVAPHAVAGPVEAALVAAVHHGRLD